MGPNMDFCALFNALNVAKNNHMACGTDIHTKTVIRESHPPGILDILF